MSTAPEIADESHTRLPLLRPLLSTFIALFVLTAAAYPALVTALAQTLFPRRANGSLVERHGHIVGSWLIGQSFTAPGFFWSRPSATTPTPYNAANSSASNLGPSNPALLAAVRRRVGKLRAADPNERHTPIPVDLVTSSASGLDPDISIAAAYYQAGRVAQARHLPLSLVHALIAREAHHPSWGFLGTPHVNVLRLNLALIAASQRPAHATTQSTDRQANRHGRTTPRPRAASAAN
ncbi:potassium-transporting ATPase subunit C [Acidihalobacter aeolianus]|uniref:Potassium-transporting ATPase KdpC subunit n=1 Tax=Acidihalobacter aeolianus TaxID=2792603 RepID=A0A1D8K4T8_9GAMM|nr:potassium-transporting ATPase subunit KdpC [Acidihalobacter aeolianus]AOV15970.1 potassium-transporting ATPase subunit C [Acidihalobacter aeolianus]